jgi:Zn finger protein HypA/HybF involved in hydrogenase expression
MNVIRQSAQSNSVHLKYCERCGNLWFRRNGSEQPLCPPCNSAESELAQGSGAFLRIWSDLRAEARA